ncbi:Lipoprotein OS=Streptomyces griseomycini OX=66895 GN=FHS37_001147 PE=4 SV=1 [Streptomyces griseomycini]
MCALLVTGTALTGCSEDPNEGTNGVGRLSADEIQSRTQKAAQSVDAVRLHGTVVTSGRSYTLDMRLKSEGGIGSVTTKGETFRLLRVGDELFLKAGAEFWGHGDGEGGGEADAAAAGKLAEKYVKVPQGDPSYKKFSGFTDKDVLLGGLLTLHGELATDGHHEQAGVRTIRITGDRVWRNPGRLARGRAVSAAPGAGRRGGHPHVLGLGIDFPLEKPAKGETLDYGKQLPTS